MLKKIMAIAVPMIFSAYIFVGCGGAVKSYSLTDKNTIEGVVEYQIKNIKLVDRVDPIKPNEQYKYFKPKKPENTLLDIEIEVKNLKPEKIKAKELLDTQIGTVKMNEGNKIIESVDGGDLLNSFEEEINVNESRLMHFIYEVDPKILDAKVKLDVIIGEKRFSNKIKISELNYPNDKVKIGDTISKENYAEIKLLSIDNKEKLEPSNAEGVYTYYYSQNNGGKLKVLTIEIKNKSDNDLLADKVVALSGVYEDELKYSRAICESVEGKNLEYASTIKIAPNETKRIYLYYDMKPEEIEKITTLRIGFGLDKYELEA